MLDRAVGASYIILAKSLPPDIAIADGLSMDKLSRLVWGEGKWVSSAAVEPAFVVGRISGLYRKRIETRENGKIHAVSPSRWRSPILVTFKRKPESDGATGDSVYRDGAGPVLNVTDEGVY